MCNVSSYMYMYIDTYTCMHSLEPEHFQLYSTLYTKEYNWLVSFLWISLYYFPSTLHT